MIYLQYALSADYEEVRDEETQIEKRETLLHPTPGDMHFRAFGLPFSPRFCKAWSLD
jgi:hypothetical protein